MTRALLVLSILLVAVPSHARFGKRSEPTSEDSDSDSSSNTHKARPAPPQSSSSDGSEHEARPAPPRRSEPDHDPVPVRHGPRHHGWGHDGYHYGWGFGYYPYFWAPRPVPSDDLLEPEAPPLTGTVGLTGQLHNQGGTILAVEAAVEGERWGANLTLMGIFVAADDSGELDTLKILDLHATFALLNGQHGRLRLELGIDTVFAPDLTVLGPDAGVSGALALVGPLGLEGSAHYSPWPHQRVEGFLGLTLGFGRVGLRLGWRHLWLDDRALLPGEPRHTDTFTGPLLGLSLAI